jgi:hypothetical protein
MMRRATAGWRSIVVPQGERVGEDPFAPGLRRPRRRRRGRSGRPVGALGGYRPGVNPNALYTYVESRAALERELVEPVLAESDIDLLSAAGLWLVAFAVRLLVLARREG